MTGSRATGCDGGTVILLNDGVEFPVKPRVIVGADGPASVVRRWMGLPANEFVHARQLVLPLKAKPEPVTEIFFRKYIPGGYGWVFPKGDIANVGAGVDPAFGVAAGDALGAFVAELLEAGAIAGGEPLARTGGVIPVGGQSQLVKRNMILAGDAAGHCHPVTGAGVPGAVFAGELAGEAAAAAAAGRNLERLADYEESCRLFLGGSLDQAVRRRRYLNTFWNRDDKALSNAIRKSWIAFDEYQEESIVSR